MIDFRPMADRWCRAPIEGGQCQRDKGHDGEHEAKSVTPMKGDGTPQVIADALEAVGDHNLPIEDRAGIYAVLRHIRLKIDRALREPGREIQQAMAEANAESWGPIRLTWKAADVRYRCNDPDNWGDDGVQEHLAAWAGDSRYSAPDGTQWVKHIPAHYEVDTKALGAAVASGDPAARDLYRLLNDKGFRTEDRRDAVLTVVEPKGKAA